MSDLIVELRNLAEWPDDYGPASIDDIAERAATDIEELRAEVAGLNKVLGQTGAEAIEMRHEAVVQKRRAEQLAEALRALLPFVATQAVGCHGDKCRESWCYSCNGEEEADEAAERGREAYHAAHVLLRDSEAA